MPLPRIRSIEFISPVSDIKPESDNVDVQVKLEDGSYSSFVVATPDQPAAWMANEGKDYFFGSPILFVDRLDKEAVKTAVEAMASDMGGYWLRYYNSLGDLSGLTRAVRLRFGPGGKGGK